MTANTPENPDPQDTPVPPPAPGYAAPPPAPGYTAPPPPAPGYSAPPPASGYTAPPPAPAPGYAAPPPAPGYGQPQGYAAPQGAYPPAYAVSPPLSDSDQRMWAVLSHIGSLIFSFLAPLIVWLVFKGRGAFLDDQAKESLNFQITFAIASAAASIFGVITLGFGFLVFFLLVPAWLVFVIIASVQASQGVAYRYPMNIRLVK